jgi:hypothetical protein
VRFSGAGYAAEDGEKIGIGLVAPLDQVRVRTGDALQPAPR